MILYGSAWGELTASLAGGGGDMDLDNLTFFRMVKARMTWAAERQRVLAQNVANADTPHYQPLDVKDLDFKAMAQATQKSSQVKALMTDPAHLPGTLPDPGTFRADKVRRAYETSPDGNGVVLEDQMMKMNDTKGSYDTALALYQKQLKMIRFALGRTN